MLIDEKRILNSRRVPTLPAVAVKLLNLINDESSDRQEIAETIKLDPAIGARLLQACNSNYYGLRTHIRSIEHAVLLLGPGTLTSLCLTFSLSSFSFPGETAARDFSLIWEQSILRAVAADTIAATLGQVDTSGEFTRAILCDIGRLAILTVEPQAYHPIFEKERDGGCRVLECEQQLIGVDHVAIGTALARQWNIPETFTRSIAHHHASFDELKTLSEEPDGQSLCVLAAASLMSEFILLGQNSCHYEEMVDIARHLLNMEAQQVSAAITEVRRRADDLPQELNINAASLPPVDELRDAASDLLAAIAIHSDAKLASMNTEHRLLEMKNGSLKKTCEELEQQANIDFLTQLYNRNYFDEYLAERLSRNANDSTPVGVLMCDIDKFKEINDVHGHQAGDAILREVARRVVASSGKSCIVARYGGEEFILATEGRNEEEVQQLCESIRSVVADREFDANGKTIRVTLSAGFVTTTCLGRSLAASATQLVYAADSALYEAKRRGRNRVVGWNSRLESSDDNASDVPLALANVGPIVTNETTSC